MVVLQMEFVLHVQELLISCPCVLPRQRKNKRWEKPDPDEKHSKKWKVYLYIITFFNSDEKEDDSIGNSQEEVSCCNEYFSIIVAPKLKK